MNEEGMRVGLKVLDAVREAGLKGDIKNIDKTRGYILVTLKIARTKEGEKK